MNSHSALKLLNSIDQTILEIESLSGSNTLNDSYLAKFLVVYISGIYEESIETILTDFAVNGSSRKEIASYVENTLNQYFRNPNFSDLIKLITRFDNLIWTEELKKLSSGGLALDSIVNNKNSLAHGQSITITLNDIKQFYKDSRPVIEKVDSLLV